MSSSNKTELGLNLWLGGDKPKREDFCNDNLIIDKQITEHKNDVSYHVSQEDREKWNKNVHCGVYYGSGESVRNIQTGCPFKPSVILIFGVGVSPEVWDKTLGKGFVYVGAVLKLLTNLKIKVLSALQTVQRAGKYLSIASNGLKCRRIHQVSLLLLKIQNRCHLTMKIPSMTELFLKTMMI